MQDVFETDDLMAPEVTANPTTTLAGCENVEPDGGA